MDAADLHTRLLELEVPRGPETRCLRIGSWEILVDGLDRPLAEKLDRRWGKFVGPAGRSRPTRVLDVRSAGAAGWLEPADPGELYRIEAAGEGSNRVVVSYQFAICHASEPGTLRVAIADGDEPTERTVENAMRYLVARWAVESGGFALHGAGVQRDGRGWLFAGPSGSGKTTAVGLAAPAASLGDDYAVVIPSDHGWVTAAVPFDNAERIGHDPPRGWIPVAGIWRLHQATEDRVERQGVILGIASLMGCVAFPWAMPDLAPRLLEQVRSFVATGSFAKLMFRKDADLWNAIAGSGD